MGLSDAQRVTRGLLLILQAAAREQIPAVTARIERTRHHVADVVCKLPQALPNVLAMRSSSSKSAAEVYTYEADAVSSARPATAPTHRARTDVTTSIDDRTDDPTVESRHHRALERGLNKATAHIFDSMNNTTAALREAPVIGAPAAAALASRDVTDSNTAGRTAATSEDSGGAFPAGSTTATNPAASTRAEPAAPMQAARREFRERSVPASPMARLVGFGGIAASLAVGAASQAMRGVMAPRSGISPVAESASASGLASPAAPFVSAAQAEVLAEGLCRMRGAALKVGQMLSLADEAILPPAVAAALERVRTSADVMPRRQLHKVLAEDLGNGWRARLGGEDGWSDAPVAAASIGQVHRAVLPDGRAVAVKVQYPGVARSINSDLDNLRRLLQWVSVLPKGLYVDSIIDVAREELALECDYVHEAAAQERFRLLLSGDSDFVVPAVINELSTSRVLVSEWVAGVGIDKVIDGNTPQAERNAIARKLLRLTLNELFVWRYMQTDPNWGNFLYDAPTARIGLLDFGAARQFRKPFVDDYLRLVWAAANGDRATVEAMSLRLGFLTGLESRTMLDAHVDSAMIVGEPFRSNTQFDFRAAGITSRVARYGAVFAEQRLTPPPVEVYSLHRKLAGAFLICIRMGAVMQCRDMLAEVYAAHKWEPEVGA